VEGLEKILTLPTWVDTGPEAWFYAVTIQLMPRFSESIWPVRAIVGERLVPALVTERNKLVYVLSLDYLTWNAVLADLVNSIMVTPGQAGDGGREFWLDGMTTQTAQAGLRILGWNVKTGISLY
jgi:hypothetical protein